MPDGSDVAPADTVVAPAGPVAPDVAIGRSLTRWGQTAISSRRIQTSGRVQLVAAYVSASYVTVLDAAALKLR